MTWGIRTQEKLKEEGGIYYHLDLISSYLTCTFLFFRSTIHKLVDTADIISQLAKNTKSSSAKIRKPVTSTTTDANSKVPKLFKTTGLVATAVQARKPRKSFVAMPLQTLSPSLRIINDCNSDSEQENVKIPLKRATKKSLKLFKESGSRKLEKMS